MPVRLPLQTGASALRDVVVTTTVASIIAWLGVAVIAYGIGDIANVHHLGDLFGPPILGFCLLGAALSAWIGGVTSARMHRASDLELDDQGFAIRGGRKDGLEFTYAELKPSDLTLDLAVSNSIRNYFGQTRYKRAVYLKAQGDIHLIAETAEEDEEASVNGLTEAIKARLAERDAPAASTTVLACKNCGGPITPTDADEISCPHCQTKTRMPGDLRARLRAAMSAGATRQRLDGLVQRVLAQPGARRINVWLGVAGTMTSIAGIVAPLMIFVDHRVTIALVALAIATFFFARAAIDGRRSLRDVTLRFAARKNEMGASCCRACAGGLPDGDGAVTHCLYCGVVNVRGLDFGRLVGESAASEQELDRELSRRRKGARLAIGFGFGCVLVATGSYFVP